MFYQKNINYIVYYLNYHWYHRVLNAQLEYEWHNKITHYSLVPQKRIKSIERSTFEYFPNSNINTETLVSGFYYGQSHEVPVSYYGAAVICTHITDVVHKYIWFNNVHNGTKVQSRLYLHLVDGELRVFYLYLTDRNFFIHIFTEGAIKVMQHGKKFGNKYLFHDLHMPAIVTFQNNQVIKEIWCDGGHVKNLRGAYSIEYYEPGLNNHEDGVRQVKKQLYSKYYAQKHKQPYEISYYTSNIISKKIFSYKTGDIQQRDIEYYTNGKTKQIEIYIKNGIRHNNTTPSILTYYEHGGKKSEEWYWNGELHRIDGPAEITYFSEGDMKTERWYYEGLLHNIKGPAEIIYKSPGMLQHEACYVKNVLHSPSKNNPNKHVAKISKLCYPDYISTNFYNASTNFYKELIPSRVIYENNMIKSKEWHLYGVRHGVNGVRHGVNGVRHVSEPAVINYDTTDGSIMSEEYYFHGMLLQENLYKKRISIYYFNGEIYKKVLFFKNGSTKEELWYFDSLQQRYDGPAKITYYSSVVDKTNKKKECWMEENNYHRYKDPAIIEYYANGNIKCSPWFIHGRRHNDLGPAIQKYDDKENIVQELYYRYGKMIYGNFRNKPKYLMSKYSHNQLQSASNQIKYEKKEQEEEKKEQEEESE